MSTLLVTKGVLENEQVYHVRVPGSNPPSPAQMHSVTPPRSQSPVLESTSSTSTPQKESNENEFSCSFTLRTISNKPASVDDCTVKEQDVNLLMSLKKILVEENDLMDVIGTSMGYRSPHRQSAGSKRSVGTVSPTNSTSMGKNKNKKKRVSTRLFNEPDFEELLSTWEENSLALGAWSMGMHALLKERFPTLLTKYNYYETDKKVHLCQYLFEKSNKRKEAAGHVRVIKRINK
ncbi:hypothetical protein TrCOL_g13596 [Triparma columacea]|uniref:Uncharacterized protein n=1 Tax=Triparma columacea TaxID=722753 RepID=A0A9W7GL76_9STRA|nr:hypothetical protein TrCOL_g13596 [Triparma columacea]